MFFCCQNLYACSNCQEPMVEGCQQDNTSHTYLPKGLFLGEYFLEYFHKNVLKSEFFLYYYVKFYVKDFQKYFDFKKIETHFKVIFVLKRTIIMVNECF
jgi:hypothetical protein